MADYRVRPGDVKEDQVTSLMESYSAKLPSSFFLGACFASIIGSLVLKTQGKDENALFVGQWAAPFLLLGIYNKMVKQHGSDAEVRGLSFCTHHHYENATRLRLGGFFAAGSIPGAVRLDFETWDWSRYPKASS
jgi:hypothetical protein